jgi:3-oxoacyl-[acyl-carrier-protein] synthase-3
MNMITSKFNNIGIDGMACAVSTKWVSVESLKDGSNDEMLNRFVKNTNVIGHYECGPKQSAADLACIAARHILNAQNIDKEEVGVVVYATQYPDYKSPSTACVLQDRLGLSRDCLAFDVNLGCSGFVYGLTIVSSLMQSSNAKFGLLLAGDTPSKGVRSDNSRNLFGDASSATLLAKQDDSKPLIIASRTDGSGYKAILRPYGYAKHPDKPDTDGVFDEIGVFNFAIEQAPKLINELMQQEQTTPEDFDCLALHQANMMIMKQITKRTKFDKEKMLISIDKFANTSAASIPLSFVKKYGEEQEDKNLHSLICGYGVGLSWAAGIIDLNIKNIYPLIESDEYFDDGLYE